MQKFFSRLRGKSVNSNNREEVQLPLPCSPRSPLPPSPPHELPQFNFAPPITAQDLSTSHSTGEQEEEESVVLTSPPTSINLPSSPPPPLTRLDTDTTNRPIVSPSIIPPTPIEPTSTTTTTTTQHGSSPQHLIPPPSSPSTSLSPPPQRSNSPSPRRGGRHGQQQHHRRSSSTGSRSFRETLNAYAVEDSNGQRCVNQYIIGGGGGEGGVGGGGPLGRGTYAVVEKAIDRETGLEYAIKEFSKRRLRHIAAAEQQRRERLAHRSGGSRRGRGGSIRGRGRGRGGLMMMKKSRTSEEDEGGGGGNSSDSGPDNLDLVRTEVAIMKKVDHPNIASVHEVIDVTSDDALLMMELCRGGPIMKLKDGERTEPYSEEKTRDIFRQLTLGIAYLHHNEIVHRDIKPDNALFADVSKTRVKLVDFGVSKFARAPAPGIDEKKTPTMPTTAVAGSPAYMAPELIDSSDKIDDETGYACDCWSLGVTLYALAVGHLPFMSSDPLELFRSIREDDPKIPDSLSPPLRSLLSKLLTRDFNHRATIPSLWEDEWLTENGQFPLPDYDENVSSEIDEPSPNELHHALAVYRGSTFLALSAAAKFKGLLTAAAVRRANSQEKENSLDGSITPPHHPHYHQGGGARTPSGTSSPALVDSPSGSPILEPLGGRGQFAPPSPSPSCSTGVSGGRNGSGRIKGAPRRFDTVSSLSIGEGTNEDDDDDNDDGGISSTITTPDRGGMEEERRTRRDESEETEVVSDREEISKSSGVPDFERDGQVWEEPE